MSHNYLQTAVERLQQQQLQKQLMAQQLIAQQQVSDASCSSPSRFHKHEAPTCVLDIPASAAINPHIAVALHSAMPHACLASMQAFTAAADVPPPHATPTLAAAPCPCLL